MSWPAEAVFIQARGSSSKAQVPMSEIVSGSTSTPGEAYACYISDCQQPAKWRFKCSSLTCPGLKPLAGYGGKPGPVDIRLCQQHRDGHCRVCQKRIEGIELQLQRGEICTLTAASGEDWTLPEDEDGIAADEIGEVSPEVADETLRALVRESLSVDSAELERRWQAQVINRLHQPWLLNTPRSVVETLAMVSHLSKNLPWVEQACQDGVIASMVRMLECPIVMYVYTHQDDCLIPATLCLNLIGHLVSRHPAFAEQALDSNLPQVIVRVIMPAALHFKDAGLGKVCDEMVQAAIYANDATQICSGAQLARDVLDVPTVPFQHGESPAGAFSE